MDVQKKMWLLFLFLGLSYSAFAQNDLLDINQQRLQRQKTAMTVLGTWAIGNLAMGGIQASRTSGENRYFHQMNAGWNVVNLAIAGFGYYSATTTDPSSLDLYTSLKEQQKLENLLLFNGGLDVGYVLGGLYLMERSKRLSPEKKPERLKGFGRSIIVQGGFLFAFDLATYFVVASGNERFEPLMSSNGVGMVWHF